jgi:hypothetical protein
MANDIDVILCDIISVCMKLDQSRVVVYSRNWKAPNDSEIYIVVSTRKGKVLSTSKRFDSVTDEEVQRSVTYDNFDIDITSRNRDALNRKEEVLDALTSSYSNEVQIRNSIKIFRLSDILDLTFIEGASGLLRFRLSGVVSNVKEKRMPQDYYNKIKQQEVVNV